MAQDNPALEAALKVGKLHFGSGKYKTVNDKPIENTIHSTIY